jgi:riboflavin synthase
VFTGIIETIGKIKNIEHVHGNIILDIETILASELKIDQSIAHNGICLTITQIENSIHRVCAVPETIAKTTINTWKKNDPINIERGMLLSNRLDGHLVQGHVDCTAICVKRIENEESWNFTFQIPDEFAHLIIEKGSITVNGTSLTCFNMTKNTFDVAIIPYTYHHTTIAQVQAKSVVNIEFDILGKYISRRKELSPS